MIGGFSPLPFSARPSLGCAQVAVKMLTQSNPSSATATMQERAMLQNLQKEAQLMSLLRRKERGWGGR